MRTVGPELWNVLCDPKTHICMCGKQEMEVGVQIALDEIAAANGQ